jgi:hypothetical protein
MACNIRAFYELSAPRCEAAFDPEMVYQASPCDKQRHREVAACGLKSQFPEIMGFFVLSARWLVSAHLSIDHYQGFLATVR